MSWSDPCSSCGRHRADCDCDNWNNYNEKQIKKVAFEIDVVARTNELIQIRITRGIQSMDGWCVPFAVHLAQAVIDAKYLVQTKINSGGEKEIWGAIMKELNNIIIKPTV